MAFGAFSDASGNNTENKTSLRKLNLENFTFEHVRECQHGRNNDRPCPTLGTTDRHLVVMNRDLKVEVLEPANPDNVVKLIPRKTHGVQSWGGKTLLMTFAENASYLTNEL